MIASPKSPTCKAHSVRGFQGNPAPTIQVLIQNTAPPRDHKPKPVCPQESSTTKTQKRCLCYSERTQKSPAAQKHSLQQKRRYHLHPGSPPQPLGCQLMFLTLPPLRCLGTAALTTLAGAECSVEARKERWLYSAHQRGPRTAPHPHHCPTPPSNLQVPTDGRRGGPKEDTCSNSVF